MLDEGAEEDEAEDDAADGGDKGGDGKPSSGVDMSEGIEALHAVANLTLAWIGDKERVAPEPLLSTACILHDLLFDLQVTLARLVGGSVGSVGSASRWRAFGTSTTSTSTTFPSVPFVRSVLPPAGYGGCGSPRDHFQDLRGVVVGRAVQTIAIADSTLSSSGHATTVVPDHPRSTPPPPHPTAPLLRPGAELVMPQVVSFLLVRSLSPEARDLDIKRLYAVRGALLLLDFDDPSIDSLKGLLLRCASHPAHLKSTEGRRFLVFLFGLHPTFIEELHETIKAQIPMAKVREGQ